MTEYTRPPNEIRLTPGGMYTAKASDLLQEGQYVYLQNVRAYLQDRLTDRAPQSSALQTLSTNVPHSLRRLNDSTPSGPSSGYALIIGAAGLMYVNSTEVASGLSGNPVSITPFRPNASVQPWAYIGDSSQSVTITSSSFSCTGMLKIRSDGLTYKTGIKEPQSAPAVSTEGTTTTGTATLLATSFPWTNAGGLNPSYAYGQRTTGSDGTTPVIILIPTGTQNIQLTVTGSATVNSATHSPSDSVTNTTTYPGYYIYPGATGSSSVVLGAFCDSSGNVITGSTSFPNPVDIGSGRTLLIPTNATQLQVGVNSSANTYSTGNNGSFTINYTITVSAIATVVSTQGDITAYYWGDSPHSGAVASYIWRNPNDTGSGTARTASTASGSATNNSWEFDLTPSDQSVAVVWNTLDSTGAVSGSTLLFTPALESQGFQDFNCCIVGSIFIPAAGTYTFQMVNKDQAMLGLSGAGATWTNKGSIRGILAQTETVVDALPLAIVSTPNGTGTAVTNTVAVTFTESGTCSVEIDWDYWYHTGRTLVLTCSATAGATPSVIVPLPSGTRTNVSYAYKYRSSKTGAVSNPSPDSAVQVTPVLGNTVTSVYSTDPQVDKVDYYRQDSGLTNYTYVGTGPNDNGLGNGLNTAIVDNLSDTAAAANSTMQSDDFEPYPSIDLPKSGVVDVVSGVITWVSGDTFNVRWLPGTIILIGSPTQLAYTLTSRPTSTTSITLASVPDGTNLVYNIAEPILAAQPMPSQWGPTDNTAYMFACGDTYRPGTLYFTKGNSPDSAPDTNQIEVTSPSEPLMNGAIIKGISMVFSTERFWLCYPTFTTALATVSGVSGSPFNLILADSEYGLYIRPAIGSAGGKRIVFRAKDSIRVTEGGASTSISDAIYNLFPHGGQQPSSVTVGGYTVYPPNDNLPELQKISWAEGCWFYDYVDVNSIPRTLVYDEQAKGWSVDVGNPEFTIHAPIEGEAEGTYVGCLDGTVRQLLSTGNEYVTSVIATGALNGGDARANKQIGDVFFKALVKASNPVTVALWQNRYASSLSGFTPTSLTGTGTLSDYIVDLGAGSDTMMQDISTVLSWPTGSENVLELFQPDWILQPETTGERSTDWTEAGISGNKFVQGMLIEADSSGAAKAIQVQRSDDGAFFTPNESPATFTIQTILPFTFTPPFLAHMVRLTPSSATNWRLFNVKWIVKPYPEETTYWATEGVTHDLHGFQHLYLVNLAYVATATVTLTVTTDQGPTPVLTFPVTSTGLNPAKIIVKSTYNKFKVCSYTLTSTAPFYLFKDMCEVWIKEWGSTGAYTKFNPFGGDGGVAGAEV